VTEPTRFAIFLLLKATDEWLRLARENRREISARHVGQTLAVYPSLKLRQFDAEAFTTDCSDVMLIETESLTDYYDFIERLRDSPIVTVPYFRFIKIIVAIEDGFRDYEERTA